MNLIKISSKCFVDPNSVIAVHVAGGGETKVLVVVNGGQSVFHHESDYTIEETIDLLKGPK